MIGNFYMFSKDCKLIIDNRLLDKRSVPIAENVRTFRVKDTYLSGKRYVPFRVEIV